MKKRLMVTLAASALIGALAVGGTVAYLTDNEVAQNTFTIGKVQIDLLEPAYVVDNAKKYAPESEGC
ncbi:TasA family protein [Clostridium porci]|uniref:SipW-cognate class signal peptide n=1 Tax=Clostridium porci TaxID=2605778 RepID=A0A7X2NPI1_9CLOT|nr:TasA family protein [Clostridium porci]MSS38704.1 hypothetical protein [Clostridium porci]